MEAEAAARQHSATNSPSPDIRTRHRHSRDLLTFMHSRRAAPWALEMMAGAGGSLELFSPAKTNLFLRITVSLNFPSSPPHITYLLPPTS